jgi:hypothetical protein
MEELRAQPALTKEGSCEPGRFTMSFPCFANVFKDLDGE